LHHSNLSNVFLHREVETLGFALWRNITALLLVLILVAQSVRLVVGVVHDRFVINQTWDSLGVDLDAYGVWTEIYYVGLFFYYKYR
jgi:hypothetical protein